jgi:hypothetical protein
MRQFILENPQLFTALVAFAGVIAAATLTLYWNFRNAKLLRKQPFLEKQLDLCLEATNVAAVLATTTNKAESEKKQARFWELFWGPLAVVENDAVSAAMMVFGAQLDELVRANAPLPFDSLQEQSIELAEEVRKLILVAWSITSLEEVLTRPEAA